jgi:uncharacterized protein (DUF2249 family)
MTGDYLLDGRDLSPPEPLERTLEALETLPADAELTLLLYCQPHPLFNVLRQNGYAWTEEIQPDGTHVIRIRKRPPLVA